MAAAKQRQASAVPASAGGVIAVQRRVRWKHVAVNWQLYVLVALPVAWLITFLYVPMYGNIIAFKNFIPVKGILGSPWIGFDNFTRFFRSYNFRSVMWNTFFLSGYDLLFGFPIPIILALALHYSTFPRYRKTVQMVTYAPHFISTVVMVGIIFKLMSQRIGLVNMLLTRMGLPEMDFLGSPVWFSHVYVWTGIWQGMGWGTIIYLAALSGIDPELHEAARVDGANIWQRMWYIDVRGILPTVVILLILRSGSILSVGFEKVFLMQNPLNIRTSEVIATYVYKVGLASALPSFHYAAAIGLFGNVINFALLVAVNFVARRVGETSLW
jgi:putative aldouronate transport system permease protein